MLNLVIKYLEKTNNSSKLQDFEGLFYSHPNYPSLYAITESLQQLSIENIAANVPFIHEDKLPTNYIAQLKNETTDYHLITKKANFFIVENSKNVKSKISPKELENQWTGIVILIEEKDKQKSKYTYKASSFIFPVLLFLLTLSPVFYNNFNLLNYIFSLFTGLGFYLSIEILKTYFKNNPSTESKFCSISQNFSCNSIINSKSYYFSKYLELVDLPVLFFSISFFSLILGFNSLFYFGFISILSYPLLIYSIYLQKFILKKWCLLCLLVALIIFCVGFLFMLNHRKIIIENEEFVSLLYLTFIFISSWFILKKHLIKSKSNLEELNKLLRFKRSKVIFNKISQPIVNKAEFDILEKIVLGNKNAKNTITLFLSPSCGYCHVAFKQAIELINKYDVLKLEICFNININNSENPFLIIYKTILYLYNNKDKNYYIALNDWHARNISFNEWMKKWSIDNNFMRENSQIENHYQWCLKNDLNYSPIKIFNSFMIDENYEINDLFYFFDE